MSDGFMADPIRPGDIKDSTISDRSYRVNRVSSTGGLKFVMFFFVIMFMMPFAMAIFFFITVWNEAGNDIFQQVKKGISMTPSGYYELSDSEQMAASRIFGTGILYNRNGPKAIAQSDCRYLKNAVTGYNNANSQPTSWYDNTYCEAGNVEIDARYLDENEESGGGSIAHIDIQSSGGSISGCVNISFAHNFRFIVSVETSSHCVAHRVEIKADDVDIPELRPLNDSIPEGDDANNPPIDKSVIKS